MDSILNGHAHFMELAEIHHREIYDMIIPQTESVWSLSNPPFKTIGTLHPLSYRLIQRGSIFSLPTLIIIITESNSWRFYQYSYLARPL